MNESVLIKIFTILKVNPELPQKCINNSIPDSSLYGVTILIIILTSSRLNVPCLSNDRV